MFLLDTNALSELRKVQSPRTSQRFVHWAKQTDLAEHFVSAASVLEIEVGILRLEKTDPRQAWLLREWQTNFVLRRFRGRILPITLEIAHRAAYVLTLKGEKMNADVFIAATAYIHDLTVVTRNTAHFKQTGVKILNPWEA